MEHRKESTTAARNPFGKWRLSRNSERSLWQRWEEGSRGEGLNQDCALGVGIKLSTLWHSSNPQGPHLATTFKRKVKLIGDNGRFKTISTLSVRKEGHVAGHTLTKNATSWLNMFVYFRLSSCWIMNSLLEHVLAAPKWTLPLGSSSYCRVGVLKRCCRLCWSLFGKHNSGPWKKREKVNYSGHSHMCTYTYTCTPALHINSTRVRSYVVLQALLTSFWIFWKMDLFQPFALSLGALTSHYWTRHPGLLLITLLKKKWLISSYCSIVYKYEWSSWHFILLTNLANEHNGLK